MLTGDVTATFDRKLAALRCHASQLRDWDPEERLREFAGRWGSELGVGLGESFTVLRFAELDAGLDLAAS